MSGFKRGANAYFAMDNAAGTLVNLSAYMDTVDFPQTYEQLEVTTFGTSTARSYIGGFVGGDSIPVGGPYDVAIHSHLGSCLAAQYGGTASFSVLYGPGGSTAGEAKISCEVTIKSYRPPAQVSGPVKWAAELQITGAISNAVF